MMGFSLIDRFQSTLSHNRVGVERKSGVSMSVSSPELRTSAPLLNRRDKTMCLRLLLIRFNGVHFLAKDNTLTVG